MIARGVPFGAQKLLCLPKKVPQTGPEVPKTDQTASFSAPKVPQTIQTAPPEDNKDVKKNKDEALGDNEDNRDDGDALDHKDDADD